MDTRTLIDKYNTGTITRGEKEALENYLEQGEIKLSDLKDLNGLMQSVSSLNVPEPSEQLTVNFYKNLHEQQARQGAPRLMDRFKGLWQGQAYFRLAYSLVLVIFGLAVGFWIRPVENDDKLEHISSDMKEMKEMVMLSLIERESISDRLKAVNLTNEMTDASGKVTRALLRTLNSDENVNVRLASIDALYSYAGNPKVREGLIKSIPGQQSPMVQMALAEMMVNLQEKRSVNALESIVENNNTPPEVKEKIEESILTLI